MGTDRRYVLQDIDDDMYLMSKTVKPCAGCQFRHWWTPCVRCRAEMPLDEALRLAPKYGRARVVAVHPRGEPIVEAGVMGHPYR